MGEINDYLALWGAVLSTSLALVKGWEVWKERSRIEIGYGFHGLPDIGNTITVRNLSGTPFTITYWELQFSKRAGLFWKVYNSESPGADNCDIFVDGHKNHEFCFSEENHFPFGKALNGKRLYLVLYIAGKKRPVRTLFYKGS